MTSEVFQNGFHPRNDDFSPELVTVPGVGEVGPLDVRGSNRCIFERIEASLGSQANCAAWSCRHCPNKLLGFGLADCLFQAT